MSKKEIFDLLKLLSDAINLCDKLNLSYGDELMQMICDIKEFYGIED